MFTDELNSYNGLSEMGYKHLRCHHGALQYVIDDEVYTNNIEGFRSHLRRMITGCYHNVSDEHLQSYTALTGSNPIYSLSKCLDGDMAPVMG